MKNILQWLFDQHDPSRARDSYESAKIPTFVANYGARVNIMTTDPDVVQDCMVTKNKHFDKTGAYLGVF